MNKSFYSVLKGDTAETILLAELVMRGYNVSIPLGHDNPYDLVVEGRSGVLYKVQVKSLQSLRRKNSFQINYVKKYIDRIDMLAVLILDTWYFFDNEFVRDNSNKYHLSINIKRSHEHRKENFDVFL